MRAYRDQYAELFNEGRNVVLMAISNDPVEEGASWLRDEDFPYLFGSDPDGAAFVAFGGTPRDNGMVGSRAVIVVGPDGRVAEVIPQFNQMDPTAYEGLAAVIDEVTPEPDEGS